MWCLLVLAGWLLRPSSSLRREIAGVTLLLTALARVEEQVRSGSFDWRPDVAPPTASPGSAVTQLSLSLGPSQLQVGLEHVFDAAWYCGHALGPSLEALRLALVDSREVIRTTQALQTLFAGRAALMLLVGMGVRLALNIETSWLYPSPAQALAFGMVAAVVFATQMLLRIISPQPWLIKAGALTPTALAWLQAHIETTAVAGAPQFDEVQRLCERELISGVSLAAAKRDCLSEWSSHTFFATRQRLKRLEDLLPAFELIGLGLPIVVLLLPVSH